MICLAREDEHAQLKVLSPFGICQERLFSWGPQIQCAISNNTQAIIFKTLNQLQPYHWTETYYDEITEYLKSYSLL